MAGSLRNLPDARWKQVGHTRRSGIGNGMTAISCFLPIRSSAATVPSHRPPPFWRSRMSE